MEEVDKIIIHTLKDIGCCIEEDVKSLGEFNTELVFEASVRCLEIIVPHMKIPRLLPENMAAKFQHSASIAEACKSIGYKGEIGYQTFLYSNVIDFRKVLMFLIDKLPRDQEKVVPTTTDNLSKTKVQIASVLKRELNERQKVGEIKSVAFISVPLETGITYPDKVTGMNPQEWREYCKTDLPWLTEQCDRNQLFPSVCKLLDFDPSETKIKLERRLPMKPKPKPRTRQAVNSAPSTSSWLSLRSPIVTPRAKKSDDVENGVKENHTEEKDVESKEEIMEREVEQCKHRVAESRLALNVLNQQLSQLKAELSDISGDKLKQVETRQRAAMLLVERDGSILNDAERKVKERKEKLNMLNNQWEGHSKPLVDRIREIEEIKSSKQNDEEKRLNKLQEINSQIENLTQQISLKSLQKSKLEVELAKAPKEINRSMYTQRILEIIGSIKKQKDDIDKILKDTRHVQKEITMTSGKLERSYTVIDELIFKNAKKDEHSRRAYKLLATLHADCNDIVSYIRETGGLVREISDLQEQIETESNKKIGASLSRITNDLKQMKSETLLLQTQLDQLTKP